VAEGTSASQVAPRLGRQPDTVRDWIKRYNEGGPLALVYLHTGGPVSKADTLAPLVKAQLDAAFPGKPVPWTCRRFVSWLKEDHGIDACRETIRRALKTLGYSWKKAKKLLTKADPDKRAAFVERLVPLLEEAMCDERLVVFADPAHIHQDCDLGYGWAPEGKRLWAASSSPGLSKRVTFYGAYLYNEGQVRIWPYDKANGVNTLDFLRRLRAELGVGKPITLFWDGAPYHRAKSVKAEAERLGIEIVPLPGYSPDFMPVEELWRWFRSVVTHSQVHDTAAELVEHALEFLNDINQDPYTIADRLVVKTALDPEVEKLRVSS
jgi:transposase